VLPDAVAMAAGCCPTFCCTCSQLDDQAIFPQEYGVPFPHNFVDVVKVIFKRLFRVYAHIYHSHFKHVCSLGEEAHLNTCFKHFMYFAQVSAEACLLTSVHLGATLQMPGCSQCDVTSRGAQQRNTMHWYMWFSYRFLSSSSSGNLRHCSS
jgi:Mob1/phocein family